MYVATITMQEGQWEYFIIVVSVYRYNQIEGRTMGVLILVYVAIA